MRNLTLQLMPHSRQKKLNLKLILKGADWKRKEILNQTRMQMKD